MVIGCSAGVEAPTGLCTSVASMFVTSALAGLVFGELLWLLEQEFATLISLLPSPAKGVCVRIYHCEARQKM